MRGWGVMPVRAGVNMQLVLLALFMSKFGS